MLNLRTGLTWKTARRRSGRRRDSRGLVESTPILGIMSARFEIEVVGCRPVGSSIFFQHQQHNINIWRKFSLRDCSQGTNLMAGDRSQFHEAMRSFPPSAHTSCDPQGVLEYLCTYLPSEMLMDASIRNLLITGTLTLHVLISIELKAHAFMITTLNL